MGVDTGEPHGHVKHMTLGANRLDLQGTTRKCLLRQRGGPGMFPYGFADMRLTLACRGLPLERQLRGSQ